MYDPPENATGIPASTGIPPVVVWTGVFGVLLAFVVVGMVIFASEHGHIWPSLDSQRLKLS